MSNAKSPETRKKLSEAALARKHGDMMRIVFPDGSVSVVYTQAAVAERLGVTPGAVSHAVRLGSKVVGCLVERLANGRGET